MGEYDSAESISSKITQVARMMTKTAEELLPCVTPGRLPQFQDEDLNHLCAQSCAARAAWGDAGGPSDRPLYEKNRWRRAVRESRMVCCKIRDYKCKEETERLQPETLTDSGLHRVGN